MFYYEIDFADFQSSTVITQKIEGKLEKLEKHFDRITSAHVTVRLPHRHRNKHIYHIQVQVDIPGYTFIVNREPEMNYAHSDINVAIRDAFDKVKRKLDDFIEDRRERPHPVSGSQHGYVISYDPGNGFGFVAAEDGREIYFNSSS
ncbi:MAG TPA: HPF/RaiA family ribosome-associated protein, partial [Bdellovibrio sp.]|nr:HPF/RaiA family ribosome-associated protein [Bdellovibrio sp.]